MKRMALALSLLTAALAGCGTGSPGVAGPQGPPGPAGDPVTTFAVCFEGWSLLSCRDRCGEATVVAGVGGPCEVTSDGGPCSAESEHGLCCVCRPGD